MPVRMTPTVGCVMMAEMFSAVIVAHESSTFSALVIQYTAVCVGEGGTACVCLCVCVCLCAGLPKEPEGEEEWFCPVCKVSFFLWEPHVSDDVVPTEH